MEPSSALAKPRAAIATIHTVLKEDTVRKRIEEVLGKRAPQFSSSLVSLTNANQRLRDADPNSVLASAMTAALLDLPINQNLGFAYIVPYSGVAQFQMGYKGYIQLAMRTGQYRNLNACVVFEGELVAYHKLRGEVELDETKKISDVAIGYAAYMELVNGFRHAIYWTVAKVKSHSEQYSQAVKSKKKDSPWFTNFDSMALKTVIKSLLSKWGPLSIELQQAITFDQASFDSIGSEPRYIDNGDGHETLPSSAKDKLKTPAQLPSPAPSEPEKPEPPQEADMSQDTEMAIRDEMIRTGMDQNWLNKKVKDEGFKKFASISETFASGIVAELRKMPDRDMSGE